MTPTDSRQSEPAERISSGLVDVLTDVHGAGDVTVTDLTRVPAGASRQTWAFTATIDDRAHPLILRLDLPGAREDSSLLREAALMRAAGAAGVASPTVLAAGEDHPDIGGDFVVMNRVDGETIPRKILRDERFASARTRLGAQLGHSLARLHRIDPDTIPGLPDEDPLESWQRELDSIDRPLPTFEFALAWLANRRPQESGRALVHGDYRVGNIIVDDDGLAAVLDWELAHVGDPLEDLGWMCVKAWRFGGAGVVGGLCDLDEFVGAYEAGSGATVDRDAVFWWQVYGTLRWGLICVHQAQRHLSGATMSVELAAIGRRVSENEWELLNLLGAHV
ncbi:phosphotransferase family protein [Gordonia sp. VNQ95]|uniref:phosphotransferase family protein n=1 Tax=Gordonia sp. VNQ95 TaxID=3156619 RepID=UPI0032B402DB